MSRLLLLLSFVIWMTWRQSAPTPPAPLQWGSVAAFLGVYALLLLAMAGWSRRLARRLRAAGLYGELTRFNRMMGYCRTAIPVWLGVGLYAMGWGDAVRRLLGSLDGGSVATPGAIVGTLPALIAWAGLWGVQYPADRAFREQNLLAQLDRDLPVYAPPPFMTYFWANLRLQLLFTVVPVVLLLAAHDVASVAILGPLGLSAEGDSGWGLVVMLAASGVIYLIAPEVLRRILHTQPLGDSPLRRRLEGLCRRHRLKYRDILLWRTHGSLGNAAVMGVVPRFRYILLSDLLIETMTDAQIEAVFAHELGHVVHRHLLWYLLFVAIFLFALAGPGDWLGQRLNLPWLNPTALEIALTAASVGAFLAAFGFVSRRFERQADVFAARTLQAEAGLGVLDAVDGSGGGDAAPTWRPVGPYGATVFASALARVAAINNIPVAARSWCHGSIRKRMDYLEALGADPAHTPRFDRAMRWLYAALVLALAATLGWYV